MINIKSYSVKEIINKLESQKQNFWKKFIIKTISFFYIWYSETISGRCLQRAASLTYTTILAIFPLIAVIALFVPVLLGGVGKVENEAINFLGKIIVPTAGEEIEGGIKRYFEMFRQNSAAVGVFGIVGIMLSAVALLSNIEKSFNEIWKVYLHRSWTRLFSNFTTILVCVPILIGASIGLSAKVAETADAVGNIVALALPYIITCMAFTLAFYILPNTKVKFENALMSGIVSGFFWETAKMAFRFYVANPKMAILIKSLGAIPLFLIWIYLSWFIVLLGCELAFVIQNYARLYMENFKVKNYSVLDTKLIFIIFIMIAENFQKNNGGLTFSEILKKITIKASEIKEAVDIIKKGGFIVESETGKYIPCRPLENIKPSDILSLGSNPSDLIYLESEKDDLIKQISQNLQNSFLSWNEKNSIRDLII